MQKKISFEDGRNNSNSKIVNKCFRIENCNKIRLHFCTGSALMSIVGVYKEIQDQHMNIVSVFYLNLIEK